jgi:hypothetical protein
LCTRFFFGVSFNHRFLPAGRGSHYDLLSNPELVARRTSSRGGPSVLKYLRS